MEIIKKINKSGHNKAVIKGYSFSFFLNAPEIHTCSITGKEDTPFSILHTNL